MALWTSASGVDEMGPWCVQYGEFTQESNHMILVYQTLRFNHEQGNPFKSLVCYWGLRHRTWEKWTWQCKGLWASREEASDSLPGRSCQEWLHRREEVWAKVWRNFYLDTGGKGNWKELGVTCKDLEARNARKCVRVGPEHRGKEVVECCLLRVTDKGAWLLGILWASVCRAFPLTWRSWGTMERFVVGQTAVSGAE
jgi:hypothetical protein